MAPRSQKADKRPISFLLSDGITGQKIGISLAIRPEDLTRPEPSRMSATQTFGGAWVDNFGPGLGTLQISGHTGWREQPGIGDGEAAFILLHDGVYTAWHAKRAAAVKAGQSPDLVQLIYADVLDDICCVVAPLSFTLKRN